MTCCLKLYNKSRINSIIILICFVILFLFVNSSALLSAPENQNQQKNKRVKKYSIKWVGQFSSSQDFNKSSWLGKRIFDFIFGKDVFVFLRPFAILFDSPDIYWILDQGNQLPVKINKKTGEFDFLNNSKYKYFPSLVGLCFKNNKILFTDSRYGEIFILRDKDNPNSLEVLNDSLDLKQPTGIAFNKVTNEIWVVETTSHRISILDKNGVLLRHIGKRGSLPGEFNFPTFIWIDNKGLVYIVDSMNFRIQIFSPNGKLLSYFGEHGDGTGYFASPKGIATDSYGNIYVVDALFNTVQIFNKSGKFLYNFGSHGRDKKEFWIPSGIFIDKNDKIYIADSYNSRIQIFQLTVGK